MGITTFIKNLFSSVPVTSKIVIGAFYVDAVLEMYKDKLLLAPGWDLAPAHVNCARIVFFNIDNNISEIYSIATHHGVHIRSDDYLQYGTEGHPILAV